MFFAFVTSLTHSNVAPLRAIGSSYPPSGWVTEIEPTTKVVSAWVTDGAEVAIPATKAKAATRIFFLIVIPISTDLSTQ